MFPLEGKVLVFVVEAEVVFLWSNFDDDSCSGDDSCEEEVDEEEGDVREEGEDEEEGTGIDDKALSMSSSSTTTGLLRTFCQSIHEVLEVVNKSSVFE